MLMYRTHTLQERVRSEFVMKGELASITVMDLQPNSNYTILLYQENTHGESEESIGLYISTKGIRGSYSHFYQAFL